MAEEMTTEERQLWMQLYGAWGAANELANTTVGQGSDGEAVLIQAREDANVAYWDIAAEIGLAGIPTDRREPIPPQKPNLPPPF